jgi:hypothetical protein
MRPPTFRDVAVIVIAAGALVILGEIHLHAQWGNFEADNPTLFARLELFWRVLAVAVPGLIVGCFAARSTVASSALVYTVGFLFIFFMHGRYGVTAVGHVLPEPQFIPGILRELVLVVATGIAVGMVGARLRRRLTYVGADAPPRLG